MKKNILFVFAVGLLLNANFLLTDFISFSSNNSSIDIFKSTAYADGEFGAQENECYSSMVYNQGSRVLECNEPCCYRQDHKAYSFFTSTCSGSSYNDC